MEHPFGGFELGEAVFMVPGLSSDPVLPEDLDPAPRIELAARRSDLAHPSAEAAIHPCVLRIPRRLENDRTSGGRHHADLVERPHLTQFLGEETIVEESLAPVALPIDPEIENDQQEHTEFDEGPDLGSPTVRKGEQC